MRFAIDFKSVLLFLVVTGVVISFPTCACAQYEIREPGTYLVFYETNGTKTPGLDDVKRFSLDAPNGEDADDLKAGVNGNVRLGGELILIGGRRVEFKTALLIKGQSGAFEELMFLTKKSRRIYYRFEGRFLDRPMQEKTGGDYIKLRGTLIKFSNAKEVARAFLSFYVFIPH